MTSIRKTPDGRIRRTPSGEIRVLPGFVAQIFNSIWRRRQAVLDLLLLRRRKGK